LVPSHDHTQYRTDVLPLRPNRHVGPVATQSSTTIAVIVGGLLLGMLGPGIGERVILFVGVGYYVLGALSLRSVVEPPRSAAAAPHPSPA